MTLTHSISPERSFFIAIHAHKPNFNVWKSSHTMTSQCCSSDCHRHSNRTLDLFLLPLSSVVSCSDLLVCNCESVDLVSSWHCWRRSRGDTPLSMWTAIFTGWMGTSFQWAVTRDGSLLHWRRRNHWYYTWLFCGWSHMHVQDVPLTTAPILTNLPDFPGLSRVGKYACAPPVGLRTTSEFRITDTAPCTK